MAGPWLYAIAEGRGLTFDIDGERIPVSIPNYRRLVEDGRLDQDEWHVRNHGKDVEEWDDIFIYTGDEDRGIVGYAKIKSAEQRAEGWFLRLQHNRDMTLMLLDRPIPASDVRRWKVNLRSNLVDLSNYASELYTWMAPPAEEIVNPAGLPEGALRTITVNAYERNPEARRLCLAEYGSSCCICGFDFGAVYGEAFEEFIHVHHLHPLAEIGGQYLVDPINDLRPVCPNCHAVLHRRFPVPYTIEDVQGLLRAKRGGLQNV